MNRYRRVAATTILFLVIAGVIGACSDDSSTASTAGGGGGDTAELGRVAQVDEPMPAVGAYDADSGTSTGIAVSGTEEALADDFSAAAVGPSVIKTASIDLEVARDGLDEATRDSISIAGRFGGFVLSTATHDGRKASSVVVVRVPADSFERALAALEDLGDVKGEQISGEDVGAEFVDLEARLRNLGSQEDVLLRLMERSVSVADTIRVQRELQGVQLEIERLTGRLRYLRDQADMGTISLSLVEVGAPVDPPPAGVIARAWDRALDLALGVVAAVIVGTGVLIPIAILGLVGFFVLRTLRPRVSAAGRS